MFADFVERDLQVMAHIEDMKGAMKAIGERNKDLVKASAFINKDRFSW